MTAIKHTMAMVAGMGNQETEKDEQLSDDDSSLNSKEEHEEPPSTVVIISIPNQKTGRKELFRGVFPIKPTTFPYHRGTGPVCGTLST